MVILVGIGVVLTICASNCLQTCKINVYITAHDIYLLHIHVYLFHLGFSGSFSMENIQKTLVETLMSVRGYSVRIFEWVKHAISNGSKS